MQGRSKKKKRKHPTHKRYQERKNKGEDQYTNVMQAGKRERKKEQEKCHKTAKKKEVFSCQVPKNQLLSSTIVVRR